MVIKIQEDYQVERNYPSFSYERFGRKLASRKDSGIEYISDTIVSKDEETINKVADLLDSLGYVATTGYYDPAEDKASGDTDALTGYYYVEI